MYHTPQKQREHSIGVRGLLYPSIHLASWMDTNDQRGFCMDFLHCLEGGGSLVLPRRVFTEHEWKHWRRGVHRVAEARRGGAGKR